MEIQPVNTPIINCNGEEQILENPPIKKKFPGKKVVKWIISCTAILLVLVILAPYFNSYVVPYLRISAAKCMIEAEQYKAAYRLLNKCQDNEEAQQLLYNFRVTYGYEKAEIFDKDGDLECTVVIERDKNGNVTSEIKYDKKSRQVYCWTYLYDEHGNEIERIIETKNEVTTTKSDFIYDEKGNFLEIIRYNSEGKITSRQTYEYDSKGNKIVYENYYSGGSQRIRDEWTYDENNNVILEIRYSETNEIVTKYEMEYNERGDIVRKTYLGGYYTYTYTLSGKIESMIHIKGNTISSKNEYKYDSRDRLIEYYVYNSSWGTRREVYEYDSFGNRTMEEVYNNDYFKSRNEYEYNHIGMLSRWRQYSVPNRPADTEYVYKYDLRGNLIDHTGYDRKGNVTYSEKQKFGLWGFKTLHTKSNDENIEFERIESRYGLLGNISRQREYRNGKLHHDYKYDIWGNLTKEHSYGVYFEFGKYGYQVIHELIVEYDDPIVVYDPID